MPLQCPRYVPRRQVGPTWQVWTLASLQGQTRLVPLPRSLSSNNQLSCPQATCHETNRNSPAKSKELVCQAPAGAGGPSARTVPEPWPTRKDYPQGGGCFRYSPALIPNCCLSADLGPTASHVPPLRRHPGAWGLGCDPRPIRRNRGEPPVERGWAE